MRWSIYMCIVGFTMALASLAFAEDEDAPAGVSIAQLNYAGSGCPQGSVGIQLSGDAQALTLMFDEYYLESNATNFAPEAGVAAAALNRRGPIISIPNRGGNGGRLGGVTVGRPGNSGGGKKEKNCTLQLALDAPAGWAYSLMAVQIRGYANIDAGAWGMQSATYRLGTQGSQKELSRLRLNGPYDDTYQQAFDVPIKNLQWSACKAGTRGLRLDTRIAVNTPRNTSAIMTVDSLDQSIAQEYSIIWKQCEQNNPTRPRRGKSYTASCKVLHPGRKGHSREFVSWGRGKTVEVALQRARDKAMNRCSRGNRGEGTCQVVAGSCQSIEL